MTSKTLPRAARRRPSLETIIAAAKAGDPDLDVTEGAIAEAALQSGDYVDHASQSLGDLVIRAAFGEVFFDTPGAPSASEDYGIAALRHLGAELSVIATFARQELGEDGPDVERWRVVSNIAIRMSAMAEVAHRLREARFEVDPRFGRAPSATAWEQGFAAGRAQLLAERGGAQ